MSCTERARDHGGDSPSNLRALLRAECRPMHKIALPTLVDAPPRGDAWWHEVKLDGYRMLAERAGDRVSLTTRNGNAWTQHAPTIVTHLLQLLESDLLLDGEMVLGRPNGTFDFEGLRAPKRAVGAQLTYVVYDVLRAGGRDLRKLPFSARRAELERVVPDKGTLVQRSLVFQGDGIELFHRTVSLALEGIISKRHAAPYPGGRTRDWLKIKNRRYRRVR